MVSSISVDETRAFVGDVIVYHGTAGSPAGNLFGYNPDAETIEFDAGDGEKKPLRVKGVDYPLRNLLLSRVTDVVFSGLQLSHTFVGLALDVTPVGQIVTLNDVPKLMTQYSLALVGVNLNGDTIRWDFLRGSFTGGLPIST